MNRGVGTLALLALGACTSIPGRRDHVQLGYGRRAFSTDVSGPASGREVDQGVLTGRYWNVPDAGGAGWEVALSHGSGERSDASGATRLTTWELEGGGLWAASDRNLLRPYLAGGWWLVHAELEDRVGSTAATFGELGIGLYVRTGLWFRSTGSGPGGGIELTFAGGPQLEDEAGALRSDQRLDNARLALVLGWSF